MLDIRQPLTNVSFQKMLWALKSQVYKYRSVLVLTASFAVLALKAYTYNFYARPPWINCNVVFQGFNCYSPSRQFARWVPRPQQLAFKTSTALWPSWH